MFLILTRDTLKWHHIQKTSSINHHQVSQCRTEPYCNVTSFIVSKIGATIASINLILVSDVTFVERRGYLTLSIDAGGVGRNFFRRISSIR